MKMKKLVLILILFLRTANACWFQPRTNAVKKLVAFCKKHHFPVEKGCTIHDLNKAISKLPAAMAWVIKKAEGPEAIMARCDLDGDGKVTLEEIYTESECLNACFKQAAIQTFL
jgi:hypothetical protein